MPRSRLLVACALLLSTACVKKADFDALQAELDQTRSTLSADLTSRDTNISSLQDALAKEEASVASLKGDIAALQQTYDQDTSDLRAQTAELVKDRTRLRASVDEIKSALNDLARRKAQAEARVAQYKDMLSRFQGLIDSGRLKVKIVDGRMIVEMATDILFASGKAELSSDGTSALSEVAAVLADIPDRAYQVEGHTDAVPIKTAQYPSNWELGSARAVTVVRTLVDAGIPAERLSAATFSQYRPVADNESPEGKAANRRIEIVVVPDLAQLPGFDELKALSAE